VIAVCDSKTMDPVLATIEIEVGPFVLELVGSLSDDLLQEFIKTKRKVTQVNFKGLNLIITN
jgi:predicted transcriptional regulator